MKQRSTRFLLLVLALALMVSPMRSVLALPDLPDTQARPHCAMQHAGMPDHPDAALTADSTAGKRCPACEQGCPGEHCAGHCAALMHLCTALAGATADMRPDPAAVLLPAYSSHFSDCTTAPLFRPPIPTA